MCCASERDHLATRYCDACGERLWPGGAGRLHAGHGLPPYGYVDWSKRPGRGLTGEVGELVVDAVRALQAGLEEIMPAMGPWRHGVFFKDGNEAASPHDEGPVRKRQGEAGVRGGSTIPAEGGVSDAQPERRRGGEHSRGAHARPRSPPAAAA